jgi:alpha-L-fucosidase
MTEKERIDIMSHSATDTLCTDQYEPWLWERLEWYQDMKFGLFIHWGLYSQWGCIESWPLVEEDIWARPDDLECWTERGKDLALFQRDYWNLNKTFNPQNFNPQIWAEAAKYAGMKYVAFTTKHHDGYCLFDTKTTDYKVTAPETPFHTNPKSNIVKEVFNTFRENGFAIDCYFSKSDWKSPYYWDPARPAHDRNPNYDTHAEPERWEKFKKFVYDQIEELMSEYGHIDALWLDGGQVRPPDQNIRMDLIAEMARKHQPGLIFADRTVGGVYENIITPEQEIPDEPLGHPWESCLTMGTSWGIKFNDTYKSSRELIHMLIEIVAKGGNFLLNIGPDADGAFPDITLERLREIGDWMAVNGDAIYGTRAIAPYQEGDIRFTQKAGKVYAIIMTDENNPKESITISTILPASDSEIFMLGITEPLKWELCDKFAKIILPSKLPSKDAVTIVFTPC